MKRCELVVQEAQQVVGAAAEATWFSCANFHIQLQVEVTVPFLVVRTWRRNYIIIKLNDVIHFIIVAASPSYGI